MNIEEYAFRLEVQLAIANLILSARDKATTKEDIEGELLDLLRYLQETHVLEG
ncbi:hypothetical protein [Ectobacillus ponti]|uniref:Uncharacterized protein n=1 Tax=Ectobacillus ponti TaxID=2961894 RepID=A0AA42BSH1_9BACI|nr:hypothetical protein [Ectobacillus ponti]MCP8970539.1 hypothetical protein [Ectobacillus ponti]